MAMQTEDQMLGNLQNLGGSCRSSPSHDDAVSIVAGSPSRQSREENDRITPTNLKEPMAEKSSADAQPHGRYAHLPPHHAELLKRQVHTPEIKHGVSVLYRYCSRKDLAILIVSSLCSIASGAATPLMTVLFGNLQGVFQDYLTGATAYEHFQSRLASFVLYLVYLGIGEFLVTYVATVGFIYTGERVTARIREHYLQCCLRQNIAFFDDVGAGEITTQITSNTNLIQDGISQKVATTLAAIATVTTAFIIGFVNYWKLTLILVSTVAAWILNMSLVSRLIVTNSKQSLGAYALGGSLADEVITSIRNTIAFGTQDRLAQQYDNHLSKAEHYGVRFQSAVGLVVASLQLIMFLTYALAFWQGSKFVINGEVPLSKVLTVMMAVMTGAFSIGNVAPNIQAFLAAIAAAAKIFNTIDRKSPIDPSDVTGRKLDNIVGNLRLENIQHRYPSRPDVLVMNNLSLDIPAGKTTALVGMSGSGKSTIVGLVERFYSPIEGAIYLDGHDISTLNLKWLRQQMALVSQEPILFGTTIFNNIRHGLVGNRFESESHEAQMERVISACKRAFAHDFITNLEKGYDTNVGERGFLLSGGQKQRIAIARAIVSDPKILLLDEATSALDTKSEGVVQAALDAASEGRTTITIAHRLSTVRGADNIVVMQDGCVIEQGTHIDLIGMNGAYCKLVSAQGIQENSDNPSPRIDPIDERTHRTASNTDLDHEGGTFASRQGRSKENISSLQHNQNDEREERYSLLTLIKLVLSFNAPEWKLMVAGFFLSIICGGGNSTAAVFFAKQISTLSRPTPPASPRDVKHDSDFWSGMYVMLAFVLFASYCGQGFAFAICSERLIHRVRDRAFRTMLRQDIAYFDRDEHTAGALTSFLSTDTTHLAGLSGATLGNLLNISTTLITACALSLAIGWELALVCIAVMPVLIACGFFHFWMLAHFQRHSKAAYSASASFASEAISAIRTVASLTREDDMLKEYHDSLVAQQRRSLVFISRSTVLYAASQSLIFFCFALGFWYGGTLLGKHQYDLFQFFLCFMAVIFGAQSAGMIFSFAPDMGKAYAAASELKSLFDRQPSIDTWAEDGRTLRQLDGSVEFRDVHFRYPTRSDQPVLNGLDLHIRSGQYVALVGASGCGKSTAIALLERFYDPVSGSIFIDGVDIKTLNINNYRAFVAWVSQEPTLYQGTIRENIALGSSEASVTDEVIHRACRDANVYNFIMSLPDGFNTIVGSRGGLLSGGQKQRIAIARALVHNPKILLLDEATSALDSESEHVVQAALDKAAKGRTTIAVAHRLSTIQKADAIFVLEQGRVVEAGTHIELMGKNGRYTELVRLQSLT